VAKVVTVYNYLFLNKKGEQKEMEVVVFDTNVVKVTTRYVGNVGNESRKREMYFSEESARLFYHVLDHIYGDKPSSKEVQQRIKQPTLVTLFMSLVFTLIKRFWRKT
jgi:hypothetical protein